MSSSSIYAVLEDSPPASLTPSPDSVMFQLVALFHLILMMPEMMIPNQIRQKSGLILVPLDLNAGSASMLLHPS